MKRYSFFSFNTVIVWRGAGPANFKEERMGRFFFSLAAFFAIVILYFILVAVFN